LFAGQIVQTVGVDIRHDDITNLGLYHTEARQRLSTMRQDRAKESSLSPYVEGDARLAPWARTIVGVRGEGYLFSDASSYAPFSGDGIDGLVSPKASVILGPWGGFELNANAGYGFHSDDVRGARYSSGGSSATQAAQQVQYHIPIPGAPPVARSPLLVRTRGAEAGARWTVGTRGSVAGSLWGLDIDSEHVFLGDQGLSAPSRPSRRTGVELSGECHPGGGLHVDADLADSRARFTDQDPAGNHIPGAVEGVASAGIEYERPAAFGSLRARYFGPRPLIEDNTVRSHASTVLNAEAGCHIHGPWSITLEVFNLLDRAVSDVDYYYVSRLPDEPAAGIADVHSHPQGPRSVRLVISTGSSRARGV
jgi:hypothetical protein